MVSTEDYTTRGKIWSAVVEGRPPCSASHSTKLSGRRYIGRVDFLRPSQRMASFACCVPRYRRLQARAESSEWATDNDTWTRGAEGFPLELSII